MGIGRSEEKGIESSEEEDRREKVISNRGNREGVQGGRLEIEERGQRGERGQSEISEAEEVESSGRGCTAG